jgi:hypothetical protein
MAPKLHENITHPAIMRVLRHFEALKAALPPERTDLVDLANKAQLEILAITLRGITDEGRRAMMLASSGVREEDDGTVSAVNIFKYDQPHLIAAEAVANAVGWLESSGYVIIKDPNSENREVE